MKHSIVPRVFLQIPVHTFTVYLSGTEGQPPRFGLLLENFLEITVFKFA